MLAAEGFASSGVGPAPVSCLVKSFAVAPRRCESGGGQVLEEMTRGALDGLRNMGAAALTFLAIFACSDSNSEPGPKADPPVVGAGGGSDVVATLNDRFNAAARPWTTLLASGVVVHQWDDTGYDDKPWIPEPGKQGHSGDSSSSIIVNNDTRTSGGDYGKISVFSEDDGGVWTGLKKVDTPQGGYPCPESPPHGHEEEAKTVHRRVQG